VTAAAREQDRDALDWVIAGLMDAAQAFPSEAESTPT
jgi:hypothetical protein